MIWTAEEYIAHMTFQNAGREFFTELFGPLIGLDNQWREQGASEKEITLDAFGWDYVIYAGVPFDYTVRSGIIPQVYSC